MKKALGFAFAIGLMLIVIPLAVVGGFPAWTEVPPEESIAKSSSSKPENNVNPPAAEKQAVTTGLSFSQAGETENFILYDKTSGQLLTLSTTEFLYGAVACEMPLSFADEALKAQAVACHSYYANKRDTERANPHEALKGGDFEVDTAAWTIYTTQAEMQKKWGDDFAKHYKRLTSLVDAVASVIMTYEGEPILAAFHAQSGGMTESALTVWGADYPYLTPVDSPGDVLAPKYQTETVFSTKGFRAILEKCIDGIQLDDDPKNWVGEMTKTPSGTVVMCGLGDRKASGGEMRNFFSLRSAVFDLTYQEDQFVFTVLGYGHGVGMSQYGAQEMAKQGSGYTEILSWYYRTAEAENATSQ